MDKDNILLSIIIPTLGRCDYLHITLDAIYPQLEKNHNKVELIVSLNASTDNTHNFLKAYKLTHPLLTWHYYNESVAAYESFDRSVQLANGKYVILFGDDDVPMPFWLDFVLNLLENNSDVSLFHYNVIEGHDYGDKIFRDLRLVDKNGYNSLIERHSLEDFALKYSISSGFMSSLIFKKEVWYRGKEMYDSTLIGYAHLYVIFSGALNTKCIYSPIPLVYKRLPYIRDWTNSWTEYALIEIPYLMKKLDSNGLSISLYQNWNKTFNKSFAKYIYTLMNATIDKKKYRRKCSAINEYQQNIIRKFCTYFVIWCVPSFIYKKIRSFIYS